MGQAPGDRQLEQLLAVSAGKVLRGVAWTANPAPQGIEDRFLFSLEPGVVSRLQPAFETAERDQDFWKLVPEGFQSLTIYRNKAPADAWTSLELSCRFQARCVAGGVIRHTVAVESFSLRNQRSERSAGNTLVLRC